MQRWAAAMVAALLLVACGGNPAVGAPLARVDNVILTQQEIEQRRTLFKQNAQPGQAIPSDQELSQQFVNQFIQQNLVLGIARQRGIDIAEKDIDALITQYETRIPQQSGMSLDQVVKGQLGLPGSDSPEFRQFVTFIVAQSKIAETLVTTDTVQQDLTNQMMSQVQTKTDQVHAAHILVQTEDEAKAVLDRLAKGESFEALAKELSKDTGSAANGGDLGWLSQGQTVAEFDKSIFEDLKPGETSKTPVQTQFGYHIVKVIAREMRATMTEEEAQAQIAQQLETELQNRRLQALQQLIAGEQAKAKAENRLIEPTPAPTPAEPLPTQPAPEQGQPTPTAQQ